MKKIYIIPNEKSCNASCPFCIFKYKKDDYFNSEILTSSVKNLKSFDPDEIIITGGGEPLLHSKINDIIKKCSNIAKKLTIETNGILLKELKPETLKRLSSICLNRMHYKDDINSRITGVQHNMQEILSLNVPLELSLVLYKEGVNDSRELNNYINWAKSINVKKIIVKQMIKFDYPDFVKNQYVNGEEIFKITNSEQIISEVNVEFDFRNYLEEIKDPILRSDGNFYIGWSKNLYKSDKKDDKIEEGKENGTD